MSRTDLYVAADEFIKLAESGTTDLKDYLEIDLRAAQELINGKLGRFFSKDATAQVQTFRPLGAGGFGAFSYSRALPLIGDDGIHYEIASTVGLEIKVDDDNDGSFADETALAVTDYELRPLNALLNGEPYREIYLPSWSARGYWITDYPVQITAIYGWPAVPAAIKRAMVALTEIIRLESSRASRRISAAGDILTASTKAQSIIDDLLEVYNLNKVVIG